MSIGGGLAKLGLPPTHVRSSCQELWQESKRVVPPSDCELDGGYFHLYLGSAQEWAAQPVLFEQF